MSALTDVPQRGRPSTSLHYAVGEINGKLDQLIASLIPQLNTIVANHDALEVRVGAVERRIAWAWGAGAVVVFAITAWETIRVIVHI